MTLNDLLQHASVLKLEKFAQEGAGAEQVDHTVRQVDPLTNLQLYFAYVIR